MGSVIKEFLVGLGFSIDEQGLSKFGQAVAGATLKVAALAGAVDLSASGIFAGITGISRSFEDLGYQMRIVAPALNKMLLLRQAMFSAYSRAGIDLTKVVQESIQFNFSLDKTKIALEAIYKSVGAKFLPMLTKQMDLFRKLIFANMPKIQAAFQKMVDFIFRAFRATVQLGTTLWSILSRVYDFFERLDQATGGWSTKILEAIAIWKLLNLSFLATPLGMLLTGFVSLLALFDDFKTYQEGGKAFFDWAPFIPVIRAVETAIGGVKSVLDSVFSIIFDVIGAFQQLYHLDFDGFKESLKNVFDDIGGYVQSVINTFKDLLGVGSAVANFLPTALNYVSKLFSRNQNPAQNVNSVMQPQPLVNNNTGVNQRVSQQTNINVNSSASAEAVGKEVASHQNNVNFDLTRNLVGAFR